MNSLNAFKNLKLKCVMGAHTFVVSFDECILNDDLGNSIKLGAYSFTADADVVGLGGLDQGVLQGNNQWYQVFIVSNGSTTGVVMSLNTNKPAMPLGMTHWALAGCVQVETLNPTFMLGILQYGNRVTMQAYGVLPVPGVAANAPDTYQVKMMTREVPVVAKTISGYMGGSVSRDCQMSITADGTIDVGRITANALGIAASFDGAGCTVPFSDFALAYPQTLYWKSVDTIPRNILYLNGFTI